MVLPRVGEGRRAEFIVTVRRRTPKHPRAQRAGGGQKKLSIVGNPCTTNLRVWTKDQEQPDDFRAKIDLKSGFPEYLGMFGPHKLNIDEYLLAFFRCTRHTFESRRRVFE